jgi:cardiolipin synthase C
MPTGMVHRIAQMMNNDFGDCSRVTVTFITNSPYTTDLAPINVLARYQLGALFDHYKSLQQYKETFEAPVTLEGSGDDSRYVPATSSTPANKIVKFKYKQFWPKLEYYEYKPVEIEDLVANYVTQNKKPNSLHTKTSMLGDDLIVGSANADVRSYYMDTNNAMMIRNAHELNGQYIRFINDLVASGKVVDRMAHFQGRSFAELRAENENFLNKFAQRWKQEKRLDKGYAKKILEYIDQGGQKIYNTTKYLLTYRDRFEKSNLGDVVQGDAYHFNEQLNKDANAMDDLFKLF